MKLTEQQCYVLGRALRGLSLDGDLLQATRGSQSASAGRGRVIFALERVGLVDGRGQITPAGRKALSTEGGGL